MAGYFKLQFIKEIDGEDAINIRDNAFPAIFAATEVSFPEARTVGNYSFVSCDALTRLDFPKVESIGKGGFKDCVSVEVAEFPELVELSDRGFMGLEKLTDLMIPKVEEIGAEALSGCSALVVLDIPKAEKMGDSALAGCTSLQRIYATRLQQIGQTAFKDCQSLVEIILPSITELQPNVFEGCQSVKVLDVPFVGTVKRSAIDDCLNMEYINLQSASILPDHVFQKMTKLKCLNMKGSGILSRYQTRFGSWAYGIVDTCDIVGMDGIYSKTETGGNFFNWSGTTITSLKSTHPADIYDVYATQFNQSVFQNKADLKSVYLPRVQQILAQSFLNCTGISRLEFPNATIVGTQAFTGCTSLKYVCLSSMPKAEVNPESLGINSGCIVVCKDGVLSNSSSGWGDLNPREIEQLDENTYATTEDGKIVELEWSGAITSVETNPIKAQNPTSLEIGTEVMEIGDGAFSGFSSLKKIVLPPTITEIGDYAFKDSDIDEISIPDSVVKIGKGAFMNCRNLDHVDLPSKITQIREQTFFGCSSLVGPVDVPSSVESIGAQAFMDCNAVQADPIIRIPVEVQSIGVDAFLGINNLILFQGRTLSEIRSMDNYPWGIVKYDVQIRAAETEILRDIPNTQESGSQEPSAPVDVEPISDSPRELEEIPLYRNFEVSSPNGSGTEIPGDDPNGNTVIVFENGDANTYNWTTISSAVLSAENVIAKKPCSISVGHKVGLVDEGAFDGCWSLKRVRLPDGLSRINSYAFRGCRNLEEINIPSSVEFIGIQAFRDCRRLKLVSEPSATCTIEDQAFLGCNYLSDENGFVVVNNILFDYTGEDETVEIPHGVSGIRNNAFFGTEVKTLIVPESVTAISNRAFLGCDKIGKYIFKGRTNGQVQSLSNYPWGIANTDKLTYDANATTIHADYVNTENVPFEENEPQVIQVICNCSGGTSGGSGTTDPTTDPTTNPSTPPTVEPSTPTVDPTPIVLPGPAVASLSELAPTGKTGLKIYTKWYTVRNSDGGLRHLDSRGNQTVCTEYTNWNTSESYYLKSDQSKIFWKVQILPGRNMITGSQDYIYPDGLPIYQQKNHSLHCWYLMLTGNEAGQNLALSQELYLTQNAKVIGNPSNLQSGITPIYNTITSIDPNAYQAPVYAYINFSDYRQQLNCGTFGWQNGFCFWGLRTPIP